MTRERLAGDQCGSADAPRVGGEGGNGAREAAIARRLREGGFAMMHIVQVLDDANLLVRGSPARVGLRGRRF
jgi:hypothetical protein